MKYLSDNCRKNAYCNFEYQHDIGKKMVGVQKVIHIKKIIKKFQWFFSSPSYERNGLSNFFQNLFSTLFFSHQDRLSRFRENLIFLFFKNRL